MLVMETVFVWAAKRVANGPVREGAGRRPL